MPETFPAAEEERPVAADRPSHGPAILLPLQTALGPAELIREEIGGGEPIVAVEPERGTVQRVGTALGDDVHLGARDAAELGGRGRGGDGKFLHGVGDTKAVQRAVNLRIHVADAIQQELIGLRALASRRVLH